jgi:hypothetical protein
VHGQDAEGYDEHELDEVRHAISVAYGEIKPLEGQHVEKNSENYETIASGVETGEIVPEIAEDIVNSAENSQENSAAAAASSSGHTNDSNQHASLHRLRHLHLPRTQLCTYFLYINLFFCNFFFFSIIFSPHNEKKRWDTE